MAVVKYNALDACLGSGEPCPGFFLICGEPFLVRQAFNTLVAFLLKGQNREFCLEIQDGKLISMGDIVEQVTTFSFLSPRKVIAVKNAPLFSPGSQASEISYTPTDMDLLAGLIEKGIPDTHTLVMTCSSLDKRKKIFKTIQSHGSLIDCMVSTGVRREDLDEQRAVLQEISRKMLAAAQKTIDANAFHALVEQTGFAPETFARNIEKLVTYSGAHPVIRLNDIQAVVIRDKKDPIFNLTNAVLEKDGARAVTVLSSLFQEGFHPLQILKSLENQVRKLLLVKSFLLSLANTPGSSYGKTMNFNAFKQTMMPVILSHDEQEKSRAAGLDFGLSSEKTSGKAKPMTTDLIMAPNPNSPYPVFQVFQKSENFSLNELKQAMIALADMDYRLKSASSEAPISLENFILNFCQKGGSSHGEKDQDHRHHF